MNDKQRDELALRIRDEIDQDDSLFENIRDTGISRSDAWYIEFARRLFSEWQEPVAWAHTDTVRDFQFRSKDWPRLMKVSSHKAITDGYTTPLYAVPVAKADCVCVPRNLFSSATQWPFGNGSELEERMIDAGTAFITRTIGFYSTGDRRFTAGLFRAMLAASTTEGK